MAIAAPISVALGVVAGLGYQPIGWWWTTICGFAGFVFMLKGVKPRRAYGLGYLFGLGFFAMTVSYVGNFGWWAPVLLVCFMAWWAGLVGWATSWTITRGPAWLATGYPVVAACAWTGSEWLAQRVPFGGFAWSRFVYTVTDQPLGGWLPVLGAGGVSFIVALTGALLAWVVTSRTLRRRVLWLAVIAALMLAGGLLRLMPDPPSDGSINVGMIQGNADSTADAFSVGYPRSISALHLSETILALATWRTEGQPVPQMLVWPENSTDTDPTKDAPTNDMVTAASNLAGVPMLIGVISLGPGDGERQTTALWWVPGQGAVASVAKRNLAPFGERVPMYNILTKLVPITKKVGLQSVPGTKPGVFHVTVGGEPLVIGNVICYELAYDETVYDTVRGGAQLMTVQSSNISFMGTWQPEEQFAITRVRAMELRRWIVVTTTQSLSGLIDPKGHVVDVTTPYTGAFRSYIVPLGNGVTPGVLIGPWLEAFVSLLAAAGVLFGSYRRLRDRKQL